MIDEKRLTLLNDTFGLLNNEEFKELIRLARLGLWTETESYTKCIVLAQWAERHGIPALRLACNYIQTKRWYEAGEIPEVFEALAAYGGQRE